MITQWVWTCAFIRDSHFPLISSPVIKSSEMDLGNCTVDCHVGLGKMNKVISFFPLSPSLLPLPTFATSMGFLDSFANQEDQTL